MQSEDVWSRDGSVLIAAARRVQSSAVPVLELFKLDEDVIKHHSRALLETVQKKVATAKLHTYRGLHIVNLPHDAEDLRGLFTLMCVAPWEATATRRR